MAAVVPLGRNDLYVFLYNVCYLLSFIPRFFPCRVNVGMEELKVRYM